jgi:hypothetical protein
MTPIAPTKRRSLADDGKRYVATQNPNGKWMVVDDYTGLPAASDGREFVELIKTDALEIAEALNAYLIEGKQPPLV